jgi:hypothetical protein
MAKLTYSTIASLDGYVEDAGGGFEWAAPDEEVHARCRARRRDPAVPGSRIVGGGKRASKPTL